VHTQLPRRPPSSTGLIIPPIVLLYHGSSSSVHVWHSRSRSWRGLRAPYWSLRGRHPVSGKLWASSNWWWISRMNRSRNRSVRVWGLTRETSQCRRSTTRGASTIWSHAAMHGPDCTCTGQRTNESVVLSVFYYSLWLMSHTAS
jgi:hypothetical protein